MVKMADRITNLQPPPHYWTKEKINNYREEAQLILDELGKANEHLAKRLADKIQNYQQYC
jgi:(p)ppGpp synthase/HD superfamily hydrolase